MFLDCVFYVAQELQTVHMVKQLFYDLKGKPQGNKCNIWRQKNSNSYYLL